VTDNSEEEFAQIALQLRHSLVEELIQAGFLVSPRLIRAFSEVPRHVFVPRFFLDRRNTGSYEVLDCGDPSHHREWLQRVYSDEPLPVQIERAKWISSSSQPSLMAMMLEALGTVSNERVLEIGTGTGYNAALLCETLGNEKVVSVDIDADLVSKARTRLKSLGYHPTLAAVDGSSGYPEGGPYDRIIATCSIDRIPRQWVAQTKKGGLILANLYRDLGGGALAQLHVTDQGASGHFAPFFGGFMPTRPHVTVDAIDLLEARKEGDFTERPTRIDATALDNDAFGMFAALRLSAHQLRVIPDNRPEQFWLLSRDGSWASQTYTNGTSVVVQGGPTELWGTLEDVYAEWAGLGRPPREEFGLTVTPTGEHLVWHGSPDSKTWTL
jgi:protein-L-isoaspartate(D-aspartate) O-methyltransferase